MTFSLDLYALKYGESYYPSRFIFSKENIDNKSNLFYWIFYLIKYKDKIILVDTGFDDDNLIKIYEITYISPLKLLNELNIKPADVTDIIITHSHFDHIGNVDKFYNANIYIQQDELKWALNELKNPKIKYFLNKNKKIITFDDSYTLFNKFKITKIGGHTRGSCVVEFGDNEKFYIIIGDEAYLFDNIKKQIPVGTFYNKNNNINFLKSLINTNKIYLTFHEPLIFNNSQEIKKITE
jgi:glyoxylase-like metal-dependent hydrolase (beta-lactamase superfamily II)